QIETCVLRAKRRRMADREGDLFMYNDNGCVFVRINRHSGKKLPPVQAQIASENAPALLRHVPGKPSRCRDRKSSKRASPKTFDEMTEGTEPEDVLDVPRMEQSIHHVEHEESLHAVVGKAFPSLRERDVSEAARVTNETAILGVVHRRRVLRAV